MLYANANKDALQRIMFNLISNAIRYGGDGKYLGMFLRADQAHIYIDIVDRGRGIEKEFAASVFDRLFTMEDSRNSAMQGNGLGLTIAKNLALQLGGDKKEICKNYSRVLKIELSIMSVERRAKQCHLILTNFFLEKMTYGLIGHFLERNSENRFLVRMTF